MRSCPRTPAGGPWTCRATGEWLRWPLPRTGSAADIALDIADLATVYLGAFTFADLVHSGRARECREGAAAAADALFAAAAAPWCSTMF